MKVLVDTQCWLWMNASPEKFSDRTRALLLDPDRLRHPAPDPVTAGAYTGIHRRPLSSRNSALLISRMVSAG